MGGWSNGRWSGSRGDDEDPLAQHAEREHTLNDGIEWNWEQGRLRIKLEWGLQALSITNSITLHMMHTAQRGLVFRDFGLGWYLERRRAFARFVQMHGTPSLPTPPRPDFFPAPLSTLFLDEIVG